MNFDRYYNEPDDVFIPPESNEIGAILESAGVEDDVIERVTNIVNQLAWELVFQRERECAVCLKKAADALFEFYDESMKGECNEFQQQ